MPVSLGAVRVRGNFPERGRVYTGMKAPRPVYIVHDPVHQINFVRYADRSYGRRYLAAQFANDVKTVEAVQAWVAANPELVEVPVPAHLPLKLLLDWEHTSSGQRCFACDRELGKSPGRVDTRDDQTVFVGAECYKKVIAAGDAGWQPPKGGPRLYPLGSS